MGLTGILISLVAFPCRTTVHYLTQQLTSGLEAWWLQMLHFNRLLRFRWAAVTCQLTTVTWPASMKNIQLIDEQGRAWSAGNGLVGFSTKKDDYTFTPIVGDQFFYGGPFQLTSSGTMLRANVVYPLLLVLFFYYLFS